MNARILIVDDCSARVEDLWTLLSPEYELSSAGSGAECLRMLPRFGPDLVLVNSTIIGPDSCATCRQIKDSPMGGFTQVILIGRNASTAERLQGYAAGADDYLSRPLSREETLAKIHVQFRLRNKLTELWRANSQVLSFNTKLEQLVEQRSAEILATRDVAVFALAKLTESRDPETGEHVERMREYCRILGERLGREGLYAEGIVRLFLDDLYRSAPLHDIGKVGIPDAILLKPGRLTAAEFAIMKTHAAIGADALANAVRQSHCGTFLRMAIEITRHHHERFDGSGYPAGLAGQQIPLPARIVALADVFDALISRRVYKEAFAPAVARQMIVQQSGRHFDPVIVAAFQDCYDEFLGSIRGSARRAGDAARDGRLRSAVPDSPDVRDSAAMPIAL